MKAAPTSSRRKMCSKVRRTEVVPAPDEPVTEMMGCFADIASPSEPHQTAAAEKRRMLSRELRIGVIARDQTHDLIRAKHEGLARGNIGRRTARIFDYQADRIRFIDEPQTASTITLAHVAGIKEHAAARQNAIGL